MVQSNDPNLKSLMLFRQRICLILTVFFGASALIPPASAAFQKTGCDSRPKDERQVYEAVKWLLDSALNSSLPKTSPARRNIETFRAEITTVRVCILPATTRIYASGKQRESAAYNAEERMVFVNPLQLLETSNLEVRATLLVHEYLGALGYLDENYELTVPLSRIANLQTGDALFIDALEKFPKRESLAIDYAKDNRNYLAKGGGSSGVGGGGDATTIMIKSLFTDLGYLKLVRKAAVQLAMDVSKLDLEKVRKTALRIGIESEEIDSEKCLRLIGADDEFGYKIIINRKFFPFVEIHKYSSSEADQAVAQALLLFALAGAT